MTRRRLRLLPLGIVLTIPWLMGAAAEAQRTAPVRIGALTESWGPTTLIVGLRDGLQALGYREDRDFTIGVRFTQGNPAELPSAARDLVRLGVDLIVAGETSTAARAAQMATDRIPIVFVGGGDPVESGLVKSFAHPGGNITGIADPIPTMFHSPFYVERGGLASYAADRHELGRQAARLVDKILRGAKPADLPVEQANKFELVVNLKTARALGLAIPESLLLRATRVIDDVAH